jgi:hypothetical protein
VSPSTRNSANGQPSSLLSNVPLKIAQFANLMLLALVAGAMWGTWLGLSRSMLAFSPSTYLDLGHAMIRNFAPVMPALILCALASAVSVVALSYRRRMRGFPFRIGGLALLLVVIGITVGVEVPIDNETRVWTVTSLPSNWNELRERWAMFHAIRTFISIVVFGLFVGDAVFGGDGRSSEPH